MDNFKVKVIYLSSAKEARMYSCYGCFVDNNNSHSLSSLFLIYGVENYEEGIEIVNLFKRKCDDPNFGDCGINLVDDPSGSGKQYILIGSCIAHRRNLQELEKLISRHEEINANVISEARKPICDLPIL